MSLTLVHQSVDQLEDAIELSRYKRALRVDVAIVSSVTAAFAHLVATPGHYTWWPASGLCFVGLGIAQLVVAVLLVYGVDNRWFVLGTICSTLGVIGVYLVVEPLGCRCRLRSHSTTHTGSPARQWCPTAPSTSAHSMY